MNTTKSIFNQHLPPLADRLRPQTIEEFVGQEHLVGSNKILSLLSKSQKPFSMIFWGPPGSGKTTLARIIAKSSQASFKEISAVSSGVKDLRKIIELAKNSLDIGKITILFIDEIHRFSKSQQDALLHAVENGTIILIGATTENPSFEVISPLLSRCRVLVLQPLAKESLQNILNNAFESDIVLQKDIIKISDEVRNSLIIAAGGDARKMLNALEISMNLIGNKGAITIDILNEALQNRTQLYDKTGDYHYDTISAFIKSVRGSDPDAAIYWLATMLEGGEKPEFIARRLVILASEDVGNADPNGLPIATAGFQAVHMIGMPEAAITLAHVTTYLASSKKSNASYFALRNAQKTITNKGTQSVPMHLRNAPTQLMKDLEYGKDYEYAHSYPDHFIDMKYLPDEVNTIFYKPTQQGFEKYISERLEKLWPKRYSK